MLILHAEVMCSSVAQEYFLFKDSDILAKVKE